MTEVEELKARVAALEKQLLGTENAVFNLAIAICSQGRIDVRGVEQGFREIFETMKSTFTIEKDGLSPPMDRLLAMLDAAASAIEKDKQSR